MVYFHEAALVDSTDGMQFKVYSSTHPKGFIIAKPKYIPLGQLRLMAASHYQPGNTSPTSPLRPQPNSRSG